MTLLQPWWERWPEVLADEVADLERLSHRPPVLNEGLLQDTQLREYEIVYLHDGIEHVLTVTYSDMHPFFRPEDSTKERLVTHQQPFTGDLCLLAGGTWNWDVDDTAARLIERQMPLLLADQQSDGT